MNVNMHVPCTIVIYNSYLQPTLAAVGFDESNIGMLLSPVQLLDSGNVPDVASQAEPSFVEISATKKPEAVSDKALVEMMKEVLPAIEEAQAENPDHLFSMDDTNPSLDETVFLEAETSYNPTESFIEAAMSAATTDDGEGGGAAAGGAPKSYEAGNWGGPQIGPGGALGAYWVGGGFAANNHPAGPYTPGTPIIHPGSNLNPFYYPQHAYRFNPYVPYSFGVGGPTYGPYYNGQPYLDTGRFAPGPADAGTQVSTTTTFKNAFLEAAAEEQTEEQTEEKAETETETETEAAAEAGAENVPATAATAYAVAAAKAVAAAAQAPAPEAPAAEEFIMAPLQPKEKVFYDEYSVENGYDADMPEEWNAVNMAKKGPFYHDPEYKEFALPWDMTKPITGDARKVAFDPYVKLPVNPVNNRQTDIIPTKMAPKLNAKVQQPGQPSLLESVTRAQAVQAQQQHQRLMRGELRGLSEQIAQAGQFEPQYK